MSDIENGNGLSPEWRWVMRRVRWMTFFLSLLASTIAFSAVGGFYAALIQSRIEKNAEHIERVENTVIRHRLRLAEIEATAAAADTAVARLEEQIKAQGAMLQRIEELVERIAIPSGPIPRDEERR